MSTASQLIWPLRIAFGVWFALVFACTSFGTILLLAIVPGQQRRRSIARASASLVFRLTGTTPIVSGLEHLPAVSCVAVANHASYLDGILLTAVLPARFQFVVKREMTGVPFAHFLLRRTGVHFVDRANSAKGAKDLRSILNTAQSGASFVFFPEGTFDEQPGLRPFRHGAFTVALRNEMPLTPIAITGTRNMLPAGRWLAAPARLTVDVQKPLGPKDYADKQEAAELCRAEILTCLDEPDLLSRDS